MLFKFDEYKLFHTKQHAELRPL